jgi:hypothetical protein
MQNSGGRWRDNFAIFNRQFSACGNVTSAFEGGTQSAALQKILTVSFPLQVGADGHYNQIFMAHYNVTQVRPSIYRLYALKGSGTQ